MALQNNWYKGMNPNLEKLSQLIGMGNKPSHGYTIAETAPEVVTAPGVYFPAEKGEVIPLESREKGGPVSPLSKDNERAKLEMLFQIISMVKPIGLESKASMGLTIPPEPLKMEQSKYDILKSALSILKPPGQSKQGQQGQRDTIVRSPEKSNAYKVGTQGETPGANPTGTKIAPTGEPTPLDRVNQYQRQMTTMFSRQEGGSVYPPALEARVEELKRRYPDRLDREIRELAEVEMTRGSVPLSFSMESETPEIPITRERSPISAPAVRERLGTGRTTSEALKRMNHPASPVDVGSSYEMSYEYPVQLGTMDRRTRGLDEMWYSPLSPFKQERKPQFGIERGGGQISIKKDFPPEPKQERLQTDEDKYAMTLFNRKYIDLDEKEQALVNEKIGDKISRIVESTGGYYGIGQKGEVMPLGLPGMPKNQTTEQLIETAKFDPDPARRDRANTILNAIEDREQRKARGGIPPLSENAMRASGVRGERNEGALEGLSESQKGVVKGLVDYKYPWPGSFALRDPKWVELMGRAELYDPGFDAKEYPVRQKLRQDFTSGKSAANIRSLNTAVDHLSTLAQKAKALDNASVQFWNTVKNYGLTKVGDKRVTGFLSAATAVQNELATAFKGTATEQEIKQWRANLSASQSPAQLKESIDTAIKLLGGRLGALQSQYETGLGKSKDFRFLSDKSRKILSNLGANVDEIDPVVGETPKKGKTRDYGAEYGF